MGFFSLAISKEQAKDTGMAMVLILLLAGLFTDQILWYKLAIPALLLAMTWPMAYFPVAVVWLGMSQAVGSVMSRVILSLVYFLLVVPTGLYRRMRGKDPMQLRGLGKGEASVMKTRNHTFSAEELEHPY